MSIGHGNPLLLDLRQSTMPKAPHCHGSDEPARATRSEAHLTHAPEPAARLAQLRAMFARRNTRAVVPYLAFAVLLVVAIAVAGRELDRHITAIEAWITALRPWSVVAFVCLFVVLTSLLVPDTILSIIAGAVFGLRWGLVSVVTGAVVAAALQYAVSRFLLRARIQNRLDARPSLAAVQRAVAAQQLRLQVLLRLTPFNPATLSYLLGAGGVRFTGFLAAFLASLPGLLVEVYFGYGGKHVARMAGRGSGAAYVHDAVVLGGLTIAITAMVLVARAARRAVVEAVAQLETAPAGTDASRASEKRTGS